MDSSSLSYQFAWSLRYSTHCQYFLSDTLFSFDEYMYLNRYEDQFSGDGSDSYYINTTNERVIISRCSDDFTSKVAIIRDFVKSFNISHENTDVFSKLSGKIDIPNVLDIYLLCDYEGCFQILGGINKKGTEVSVIDHNSVGFSSLKDLLNLKSFSLSTLKDALFRLKLTSNHGKSYVTLSDSVDEFDFQLLRAAGINVPLLLIQNLYKRKVKTYIFSNVQCNNEKVIKICTDYNTVFFDLDETLIWEGKPILEVVSWLYQLHDRGTELKLLTRHEKDICETLTRIGIPLEIFKNIVKVEKHQLKSEFVHMNSIFIDNEFPQRYDVQFNGGVPSFDLDQVEFLTKGK